MPTKPIFRSSHRAVKQQARAEEGKTAFALAEASTARQVRPMMRAVRPNEQPLKFEPPDHVWIEEAAARSVGIKPRPQKLNLIRDFRRVSYKYAQIQMSSHGWYQDPLESLIYQCLMDRLEKAREAIEEPHSELRNLQTKAQRKRWPQKVYERKRAQLERELSGRHEELDLGTLFALMRQIASGNRSKNEVQRDIKRLWQKAKRRHKARKAFPVQLLKLQNRLQSLDDLEQKLRYMSWVEWLDSQAKKIFYEIEVDIVRVASQGRVLKDELPRGRKAISGRTGVWRPRQVIAIAELNQEHDVLRVVAVVTPSAYNKKRNRRAKGERRGYRNKPPRSQRYSWH